MGRGRRAKESKEEKEKKFLDSIRAKGIFNEAKRGEMFRDHPGYVDVRIRVSVYNPITKREERLPGKEIAILVSSAEEVDKMMDIIGDRLEDWAAGLIR